MTSTTTAAHPRRLVNSRNLSLLAVLVLCTLLLLVSALQSQPAEPVPFDLDSAHSTGLLALRLWLEDLGYAVRRTGGLTFALPADADLVFVYPNQLSYTPEEAAMLRAWVEAGHTLVVIGPHPEDAALEQAFGVRASATGEIMTLGKQVQPLIPDGASSYLADWFSDLDALDLGAAPRAVPALITPDGVTTAAVQTVGKGVVWHLIPGNALTNHGLSTSQHGELLPAFLRTVPDGGVIVFDTFHQFGVSRVGERISTLQDWLYRTPTGWATLFGLGAVGIFLVLQGRRLGPPLASSDETRKREAAEYVQAMAALQRRAHLRGDVAYHHRQRLKRGLARRRPISPDLPDAEFVTRLAAADPPLEPDALAAVRSVLHELSGNPDEHTLVKAAAHVDEILHGAGT